MPDRDRRGRFEEIYEHSGAIFAYAVRRTVHPDDARDVVSETFAVAWRRIDDVPEGDAARPWLYGVARRVLANQRRSARRRDALSEKLRTELDRNTWVDVLPGDGPDGDIVRAAVASLRADDRELLRLVAWDGLGADGLATALGTSNATARVRLHRARRRLADRISALEGKQPAPTGQVMHRGAIALPDSEVR